MTDTPKRPPRQRRPPWAEKLHAEVRELRATVEQHGTRLDHHEHDLHDSLGPRHSKLEGRVEELEHTVFRQHESLQRQRTMLRGLLEAYKEVRAVNLRLEDEVAELRAADREALRDVS